MYFSFRQLSASWKLSGIFYPLPLCAPWCLIESSLVHSNKVLLELNIQLKFSSLLKLSKTLTGFMAFDVCSASSSTKLLSAFA